MKEKLQGILQSAKEQLAAAADARALDEARVKFLGKKGELTALLKGMKDVAAEERPVVGQLINDVRAEIETIIDKQKKAARAGSARKEALCRDHRRYCRATRS
mgnify:CR=1 FL=1